MDKDYQNTNSVIEAANSNEAKDSEHVITVEISIEEIGEDKPTKYDKRRERWVVVAFWSFVVLGLSLVSFFISMNIYSFWLIAISVIVSGYSLAKVVDIDSEEPTGHTPWYYGAL